MRIRTGYSFRTAVGHLADVMKRVKELGWPVAPISDRNSTFGFVNWTKLAAKNELRPIYGVEIAVVPAIGEKKPTVDYWTFFALDELRPLHDIIALAGDGHDKEPTLLYRDALAAKGLLKIAGERVQLDHIPKKDRANLFIGLSPSLPKMTYTAAKKAGFKFIATGDNVYTIPEDAEMYKIALDKRAGTQTYPQYIVDDAEWAAAVEYVASPADIKAALKARDAAFARCKASLSRATLLKPEKPKTLREMCEEGAVRTGIDFNDPVYKERLDHELKMIAEKNFEDYFYIIADLIGWAKARMVVGPARGSSCGSLVCYLLDITAVNPIPFNLIFERFIDTNRKDLPDIDIDFSDVNRPLVFKYAEEKYGADHVARLGTVGMFKPRSALNAAGKALRIPTWTIEKVLDGLIERSGGDSRALQALEDTLNETDAGRKLMKDFPEVAIASRLEGHPNNAGQHAAGIVLTQEPVADFVAVDTRTGATMCDKKDAEALNLLKIDALGLTQLSIFERTLELIGVKPVSGWLEKLPLDDPEAFDVLNKGHFAGIFQFTGVALQSLTKQVKVLELEDMISITALARPGPLASGGASDWVRRKNGLESAHTLHPMLDKLTENTYGVVIYQETVMSIARIIGKFSWAETSDVRQAMSRRLGDEFFSAYKKKFLAGAAENGVNEMVAAEIWDNINTFGSWAFNRSHAVAYGLVSYWCCWLKAHHPVEFAAATLDAETDPQKQIQLLRELSKEGIDYKPVDPDHSTEKWEPITTPEGKRMLVGPLTTIKGIGPATVQEILEARKKGKELRAPVAKRLLNAVTEIDTLFPVRDKIRKLFPDLTAINIHSEPTNVIDCQCGVHGEVMIFALVKSIAPRDANDAQKVAARGGKRWTGPTMELNLFLRDDTDEIFCKVDRYKFEEIGRPIIERGRAGKAIYAIKGTIPPRFRMISIEMVRFIGFMDDD